MCCWAAGLVHGPQKQGMSCRLMLLGNGNEKSNLIYGLHLIYGSHFRIQGGPPDHGQKPTMGLRVVYVLRSCMGDASLGAEAAGLAPHPQDPVTCGRTCSSVVSCNRRVATHAAPC